MSRYNQEGRLRPVIRAVAVGAASVLLASCAQLDLAPHLRPLSKDTAMLLGKKGMHAQAPIFIRIYKEESELEVWKLRDDGRYYHFKTYPICTWSGELGPKLRDGDKQAPEGFYTITRDQMNPDSRHHLAFNLGFPNTYDKANRRTGSALMVHGKCSSAGCYAMTDALMEEIYTLAREAFIGGQESFNVHAYPFRMTEENMVRHAKSPWYAFWKTLKEAHDYFEYSRQVPTVAVCNRRYVVNVNISPIEAARLDPEGSCPALQRAVPTPFTRWPGEQHAQNVVAPGPRMRSAHAIAYHTPRMGLTKAAESRPAWWNRVLSGFNDTWK